MPQAKSQKSRIVFGICMIVITVAVGIMYIVECADLYYTHSYSRAEVGKRLLWLLAPTLSWIAAIVAGAIGFKPAGGGKTGFDPVKGARKMKARLPEGDDETLVEGRRRLSYTGKTRIAVWSVCGAVCLLSAVMSLVYLLNTAHFTDTKNTYIDILALLKNVLPWLAAAAAAAITATYCEVYISRQEIAVMKNMFGFGTRREQVVKKNKFVTAIGSERALWIARGAIFALGLAFFIAGIIDGGQHDVFVKATAICRECIGIG